MFEKGTLDGVQGEAGYFLLPMFTKEKGCQQLGAFRHFCADPSPRNCSAFKSEQLQLLSFSLGMKDFGKVNNDDKGDVDDNAVLV